MSCPQCGGPRTPGVARIRRPVVWGLFAAELVLAYVLGGQFIHDLAEGMDRGHLAIWKVAVPVAVLLLAVTAAFLRRRREVCAQGHADGMWEPLPAP